MLNVCLYRRVKLRLGGAIELQVLGQRPCLGNRLPPRRSRWRLGGHPAPPPTTLPGLPPAAAAAAGNRPGGGGGPGPCRSRLPRAPHTLFSLSHLLPPPAPHPRCSSPPTAAGAGSGLLLAGSGPPMAGSAASLGCGRAVLGRAADISVGRGPVAGPPPWAAGGTPGRAVGGRGRSWPHRRRGGRGRSWPLHRRGRSGGARGRVTVLGGRRRSWPRHGWAGALVGAPPSWAAGPPPPALFRADAARGRGGAAAAARFCPRGRVASLLELRRPCLGSLPPSPMVPAPLLRPLARWRCPAVRLGVAGAGVAPVLCRRSVRRLFPAARLAGVDPGPRAGRGWPAAAAGGRGSVGLSAVVASGSVVSGGLPWSHSLASPGFPGVASLRVGGFRRKPCPFMGR